MALVVLMYRFNFVSAGTETEATGHFTLSTIYQRVPRLYYLSKRRGLVVKKVDCQIVNGGSRPTDVLSKETSLLYIFLASHFKFKDLDLEYFLLRFLDLTTHQEVPKSISQQTLRGLVDKTTGRQPKIQQFETDHRQGFELGKFSVKIPRPHYSSESSKIKIILSTRSSE